MELEALFDAVIVKPIENEETTYGNIIVPDMGNDKNEMGEVIASWSRKTNNNRRFYSYYIKSRR